ncbi:MAG TPA: adenylate/guanylate cyclase domain-containing protein [Candidatus Dormibacteraeota bacterium]|nr:adenylate/guanylate cyclase domain-containing protein [Candidatus Dormibacteraeota bacterium]
MLRCPDCGEENPERFRLCGYCGARLSRPVASEEVRKTVTVIFCDLKGSTSLGEKLDSESLRDVLDAYFSAMRRVIERHGGTVEKYIGDAIMAVFGHPRLHEDDALRAVRAAYEMRAALQELNVRLQATWGVSLENRTGVNTGEVVAGDPTAGQRLTVGDTVNVAARLEQAAADGEVLIGEMTFRSVKDAVTIRPVEPLKLKGKSKRVRAYQLIGVSRGDAIRRRVDLPFVGRDEEVRRLLDTFARVLGSSRCEVVTILGQAGLGKSRLIEEFVRQVGGRAQVLRGRCLSYGEGITVWPIAEVFRQAAGILPGDGEEAARAKLWSLAGPAREDAALRIWSLMGFGLGAYGRDEVLWSVRALLERIARRRPLVVVFDDIHWAEQILLDVIEHLAGTSSGVPLLILCVARHDLLDDRPGFLARRSGADRIELQELSAAETAQILGNLVGGLQLPASLEGQILSVADGNPLFAEQMISMLIDSGVIRERDGRWDFAGGYDDVTVPPNISSLLASRLDRLSPLERGIIERAAVIGLEFEPAAIAALAPDGDAGTDLDPPLSALCGKRLIRAAGTGIGGGKGYEFSHILVRDAAYDRLLKRTRVRMHERFAGWLLEVSGTRMPELEEIIGYHLEQSFRYRAELGPVDAQARSLGERAARHLGLAGARAIDRGDMPAAASLLQRAADLLDEEHQDRPHLLLEAGEALTDVGELAAAEATLTAARNSAALLGNEAIGRWAELALLQLRYTTDASSVRDAVVARVRELLPVLEQSADHHGLARAWRLLYYAHGTATRWGIAAEAAAQTIRYAEQAGDELMARRFAGALTASVLYGPTPADEAIAYCEGILSRVAEDRKASARTEVALAHLEAMRGNFEVARVRYRRSRALLEEFGWRFFAALTSLDSAPIEILADDLEAAEHELRTAYRTLDQMGERNYISTTAGMLGEVLYRQGRYQESAELAGVCRELASPDDVASQFLWRCVQAKLLARDGQHERPETLLAEAFELISASDWVDWQGNGFMDLAEVCRLRGHTADAIEALGQASVRFAAKGNVVSLRRADELADKLRGTLTGAALDSAQPAAPALTGLNGRYAEG